MRPELFVLILVLLWGGLMIVIGHVTGWAALVEVYRPPRPFVGDRWWFQSARMRYATNYGLCLIAGANREGMHLSILLPFRPGHPPLFIPWTDVSLADQASLWFPWFWGLKCVELRFRRVPDVPLRIMEGLARRLAQAAGPAWPGEPRLK